MLIHQGPWAATETVREHTGLHQRATEWREVAEPHRLLRGRASHRREEWLSRTPKGAADPTTLHLEYIRASELAELHRANAEFKRLEEIDLAQIEKSKALEEKESVLRQQGRLRNAAAVALLAGAILAGWQWWRAEGEKSQAVQARQEAEVRQQEAEEALGRVRVLMHRAKAHEQTIARDRHFMADLEKELSSLKTESFKLAAARQRLSEITQELEQQKRETEKEKAVAQKRRRPHSMRPGSFEEADKQISSTNSTIERRPQRGKGERTGSRVTNE